MQYAFHLDGGPALEKIRVRLLAILGPQRDETRYDPISQLVFGILSAQERDEISRAAFQRLQRRYPSWKFLSWATHREIEALIRPVNFADKKADYLPHALRTIIQLRGSLDLGFLADRSEEAGMQWLCQLRGVDAKIGATILNFSTLRKRVLPVDRHLLRVGERLRLLPCEASYRIGYHGFMRLIPNAWDADDLYEFHWLMKYHSQHVCTYTAPGCGRCVLRDLCPSSGKQKGGPKARPSPRFDENYRR